MKYLLKITVDQSHINTNKIFLWNNFILKTKQINEKNCIVLPFWKSFKCQLNIRQLDDHGCLYIQSLPKCYFGWSIWRKSSLALIIVRKGRVFFFKKTVFSDNCILLFLILLQSTTSISFLKVSGNWNLIWTFCTLLY